MLVGNSTSSALALPAVESSLPATAPSVADSFNNAFHQCLEDQHHHPEGPGLFVYGMSRILGKTLTRRLSNLVSYVGLGQFFPAQRDYLVLGRCDALAQKFQPRLFSINKRQSEDPELKPNQIRYEVLPAQQDKNYYSIIYYVGLPTEELPIPIIGTLYNLVRPILFGSKHDWEAVQVDIHKDTGEPISLSFETANYSNTPTSYNLTAQKDLHLLTKISKNLDGTWTHSVRQKNGQTQTSEIADPLRDSTHANLCIVSWNTSLDICDRVAQKSDLKLYPLDDLTPQFLDIDTYRAEGIDLRAIWLDKHLSLMLPRRKENLPGLIHG